MAKKPSLGCQKIKIAKIEIKNHLQVTFSKRRSGLFKKASELCTLCGVELAIIVFSPAGKVFCFGHPNVESIIDRFLITRNPPPNSNALQLVHAHFNASVCELTLQLTHILNELEIEKKRGETLDFLRKANQNHYQWQAPTTQFGLHELEQLRDSMQELKRNVTDQVSRHMGDGTNRFALSTANSACGAGGFDHCEHKPSNIMVTSVTSRVQNFGYGQGLV